MHLKTANRMWLDRFSAHPTPSASPPPQNRSSSPASRRPSHLGPAAASKPGFSPRSSSLNVAKFNPSTTSLNSPRLPNGSGLKQQVTLPDDNADPLKVLGEIIGKGIQEEFPDGANDDHLGKPEVLEDIDFNGLSLHDFLQGEDAIRMKQTDSIAQSAEECEYVCAYSIARF